MSKVQEMSFDGGKYTVIRPQSGLYALRYGAYWMDLAGDKLVGAMFDKAYELEWRLTQHKDAQAQWLDKTEWVQEECAPGSLGKHRADVMTEEIRALRAQVIEDNNTILQLRAQIALLGRLAPRNGDKS